MRTAILSALALALSVGDYGVGWAWQSSGQPAQQSPPPTEANQSQQTPPAKKSDAAGDPSKPDNVPPATDTDPLKMAAPQTAAPQSDGTPKSDGKPKIEGGAPISDKTYVIGAEDVLSVYVWNSVPLTGSHVVRPDGRISIPLIGEIMAAGKTPLELQSEITERLKASNMILKPNVAVSITQVNSKKYYLEGEVNKPGQYNLIVPTTVLEALVNAGGFKDFANESHIRIIRGKSTFNFNYKQVIKNQHTEQNIYLEPGDIIVVK
jgi:polysaccharide biosynthesis/export protein